MPTPWRANKHAFQLPIMAKAAEPPVTTCHTLKPPTAGNSSHSGGASIDSVVVACRKVNANQAVYVLFKRKISLQTKLTGDVEENGVQILGAMVTMRLAGAFLAIAGMQPHPALGFSHAMLRVWCTFRDERNGVRANLLDLCTIISVLIK